ncbi:MAG: hypothetical protein PWQ14_169, partial [Rikenellaceae bacterium]|nr:hypothetical protein [Rikenellaceae bacterium]
MVNNGWHTGRFISVEGGKKLFFKFLEGGKMYRTCFKQVL